MTMTLDCESCFKAWIPRGHNHDYDLFDADSMANKLIIFQSLSCFHICKGAKFALNPIFVDRGVFSNRCTWLKELIASKGV